MPNEPPDPEILARMRRMLEKAAFVVDLGITPTAAGPGWCETELAVATRHLQQDGYVHAGVLATIGDHSAGAAAATLAGADEGVLTIEFKINLLRPAQGERIRCRAQVLRQGRNFSVVESEMLAVRGGDEKLVAKSTVTLAVVRPQSTTTAPPQV
jgi:uncharacterized protein (TIGR00369 family)